MSDRSFDSIYSDYSRLVFWAAYRVVPNRETAEDITQIAFERVLSNLGRLAGLDDGQLKSWLYRVSTNIALDHLRRAKHETPVDAPISEDIEDSALPLDEEVERRRKAAKVRSAIDKLDETSRKVILLHYYAGMTVREISACTGISEGTVKSRLMKARKRLAVMLGEEAADEKKRKKKRKSSNVKENKIKNSFNAGQKDRTSNSSPQRSANMKSHRKPRKNRSQKIIS